MRRIRRKKLSAAAAAYLDRQTARILAAPPGERSALARKRFDQAKKTKFFAEIRKKLRMMATGRRRCMYCEDSQGVDIDHFWPLARFPRRAFRWTNYLYACSYCNGKKHDQFPIAPVVDRPLLIKPTKDDPLDHLRLTPSTGKLKLRRGSRMGKETIRVFGLNVRTELTQGRRDAWVAFETLVIHYAELRRAGSDKQADKIAASLRRASFSSVFVHLLALASGPGAQLLDPRCLAAIRDLPEIRSWM